MMLQPDNIIRFTIAATLAALLAACATPQVTVVEPEPEPEQSQPQIPDPDPPAPESAATEPQPGPEPQTIVVVEPCPIAFDDMLLVGEVEHALVGEAQIMLPARIDTGAKTSSLDVSNIQYFERDGERWVQFTIQDPHNGDRVLQRPFQRKVRIKRHGDESQPRPVVTLIISVGDLSREVGVSLTDRSGFRYPLLIGRNFLDGQALVDVSRKYVATDSD